jgi:predicted GNAT family N-acyltransferase
METKSKLLIVAGMLISKVNNTFTFREITEQADLENAFHFRYEEYSGSRLKAFLKHNEQRVDIDTYDLHSKHYGVFTGDNKLMAYLRVVLDKREFYNPLVFEVGKKYEVFSDLEHSFSSLQNSPKADFPFLSYPNVPESIQSKYNSLKSNNETIAEASRLIIKEEYRGLRTVAFLIECAMVLFIQICLGKKHAVVSCCKDHCSFYERYGFRPFGTGEFYNVFGMPMDTLALILTSVPKNLPSRFEEMTKQYLTTGTINKAFN